KPVPTHNRASRAAAHRVLKPTSRAMPPDRGPRHVYAREILREDARTEQLTNAVPNKKARHQQASERRQISLEVVHGAFSSILLLLLCAACAESVRLHHPAAPAFVR